jgi:multiple sugar transport system ATP-binding protein
MGSPSMNLYEASVSGPAERVSVQLGSQKLQLSPGHGRRLPGLIGSSGRQLIVGIRPEHLSVDAGATSAEGRQLVATVELVEALGNEQLVHFAIDAPTYRDQGEAASVDDVSTGGIAGAPLANSIARVDPGARIATGERATFFVDVEHLHFFDPGTGASLAHV